MPVSNASAILPIISEVLRINPQGIADIGIGTGLYGALCRNYLDAAAGHVGKKDWKTTILGIEGFAEYRNPMWDVYSHVMVDDYRLVYQDIRGWPLVLMIDSLEHVEKDEALSILAYLVNHNERVIVSLPKGVCPQGVEFGNEFEAHRSSWTLEDFTSFLGEGNRVLTSGFGTGSPIAVSLKGTQYASI